ncbi:MAG: murein biosynthesis integral membrane protein MurJ [Rhizomicrobium sp.]
MFKRLLTVSGYTALSRVTGFMRDILMAFVLGAGPMSDAFLVAFRLPNNFRAIFGEGAFNAAFLPRFAKLRTNEGPEAAASFADAVYSWQIAAQIVLLIAALLGMRYVIGAMAPGFAAHPGQMDLATMLARIAFPYLIMTVSSVQLSAMLNAIEKFAAAAAWSILLNVAMMATLLAARWFPNAAYAAAWGVFLGGVMQLGFIAWAAARSHLRLRVKFPRWTPQVREFLWALGAATIGSASIQISLFMDNFIASFLPSGDLTALYYADRINQLPTGMFGIALWTVLLPEMSNRFAKNEFASAYESQNRAAAFGLLLTLPFVAAYFAVPMTIMRALFAHGAFHLEAAATSANALMAYGVGLPAFVLVRIVSATFYARHDTATPVRATLFAVAVNIALKIVLVWGVHLGAVGIALGTALGAWANVGVLVWMAMGRKLMQVNAVFWRSLGPTLLAAVLTGVGAYAGTSIAGQRPLSAGANLWLVHISAHTMNDEYALGLALLLGCSGFAAVVLLFHRFLPLERLRRR